MYTIYEIYHLGVEMPEDWWRPRRVIGKIVFGVGGSKRYQYQTANVLGPDFKPMLAEIERAVVTPYKNGRMVISGRQTAEQPSVMYWQRTRYQQEWLCIPRNTRGSAAPL